MISPANEILRDLIQSRIPALSGPSQVGFEPPNDDWRGATVAAGEERLNIYLHEVKENVQLRSNERTREPQAGWYRERTVPPRLDCHYLITAWSPASFLPPSVEPTVEEHARLYDVAEVLLRFRGLAPAEVYAPGLPIPSGGSLTTVPPPLRDHEMPLSLSGAEGAANLSEFWSTMKVAWRPALRVVLTIPVFTLERELEGPAVTTLGVDSLPVAVLAATNSLFAVGGHVLAGTAATPVRAAWVELRGVDPVDLQAVHRRGVTDGDGRFTFTRLRPGRYQIRAVARGVGDLARDVDVPSETGEYDVSFP